MSLFTRLTSPQGDEVKISAHAFSAMLHEYFQGAVTGGELVAMFNLDGQEVQDAIWLRDAVLAAPNKQAYMRSFKDILYLAETGLRYTESEDFQARIVQIITDQGGTYS